VVTTAQLKAIVAVLKIDTTRIEQYFRYVGDGRDSPALVQAALAGLVYRVIGAQLRDCLAAGDEEAGAELRARAASPQTVAAPGEDPSAQAVFEAFWLVDRIASMRRPDGHAGSDPRSALLEAAASTAAAARTVLRLHDSDPADSVPNGRAAEFSAAVEDLDRARVLIRTAQLAADEAAARRG